MQCKHRHAFLCAIWAQQFTHTYSYMNGSWVCTSKRNTQIDENYKINELHFTHILLARTHTQTNTNSCPNWWNCPFERSQKYISMPSILCTHASEQEKEEFKKKEHKFGVRNCHFLVPCLCWPCWTNARFIQPQKEKKVKNSHTHTHTAYARTHKTILSLHLAYARIILMLLLFGIRKIDNTIDKFFLRLRWIALWFSILFFFFFLFYFCTHIKIVVFCSSVG